MPALYLLEVPEYAPAVLEFEQSGAFQVTLAQGYVRVESDTEIVIERADVAMNEAVWFGLAVGGLDGEILEFNSERLRIGASAD